MQAFGIEEDLQCADGAAGGVQHGETLFQKLHGIGDLICGIATPSAQTAYNAAMDTDISVIYTAVTDPKAAELADDKGNPVGEVTGTSDKLPIEAQLKMIRELLPDAK